MKKKKKNTEISFKLISLAKKKKKKKKQNTLKDLLHRLRLKL